MQRENQDLLVDVDLEIPGVDAALGWIGEDGQIKPVSKEVKEPKKKEAREPEAAADAIEVIKRERDDALAREAKLKTDSQAQIEDRDQRLSKAMEGATRNEQFALKAHYDKVSADREQLDTALRSTDMILAAQEQELAAALEVGGAEGAQRAAKAQRAIARAEAEKVALESGKAGAEYEVAKAKHLLEAAYKVPEPGQPNPEPEKKDETKKLTPDDYIVNVRQQAGNKVADWFDEHRDFITDPKLNGKFLAFAQYFASVEEKPLNSKDFIAALDAKFFPEAEEEDHNEEEDTDVEVEEPKPKAKPMAAAPVSRNSSPARNSNGMSGGKVRLNSDEQAMATNMYPDMDRASALKKYAANKARAIADGKYQK